MSKSFWIVGLPVLAITASMVPKAMEFLTITSTVLGLFAAVKYLLETIPDNSDDPRKSESADVEKRSS